MSMIVCLSVHFQKQHIQISPNVCSLPMVGGVVMSPVLPVL